MKNYRQLEAWKASFEAVKGVYELTGGFPSDERFGLVNQLRRASVSATSNIAEGAGRGSNADFCRFLDMAAGSLNEVECQLLIAFELGFAEQYDAQPILDSVERSRKMIAGLIRSMRSGGDSA